MMIPKGHIISINQSFNPISNQTILLYGPPALQQMMHVWHDS
jgi:hypothetical protein